MVLAIINGCSYFQIGAQQEIQSSHTGCARLDEISAPDLHGGQAAAVVILFPTLRGIIRPLLTPAHQGRFL